MPFFLIFIIVPIIELALFASVSEHIGIWTTVSLAFLTAIIGGGLVRHQGLQTLFSMRGSMDQGQMPLNDIFNGFCIVAAGALLITPGFLTDSIGFTLLIPPVRKVLRNIIRKHADISPNTYGQSHDPNIIEGECIEIEPDDKLE